MKALSYLAFPATLLIAPAVLIAAQPIGEAQFDAGVQAPSSLVVNESVWKCSGNRCTGPAETRRVALQKACKTLSRKIGAVVSISAGGAALSSDDLERCNGTVRVDVAERGRGETATNP